MTSLDQVGDAGEIAGLDPALAQDWHVWSMVLGRTLLPELEALEKRLPRLISAMVCTADGFNLCAVNADEHQVTQLAAVTSSLFALGTANGWVTAGDDGSHVDVLTLQNGDVSTVVVGRQQAAIGHALLHVVARDTSLGQLLMVAQSTMAEICTRLELDEAAPSP